MTSRREQVIEAVKALVAGALPNAEVKRNLAKPERIAPGGLVVVRDGDPGSPRCCCRRSRTSTRIASP